MSAIGDILYFEHGSMIAKIETAGNYGSDASPLGTEAFEIHELAISNNIDNFDRTAVWDSSMSAKVPVIGARHRAVSFKTLAAGEGNAGTAPDESALWTAAGFSETIDVGVSVTYALASTAFTSATLKSYIDGVLFQLLGARGNLKLNFGTPGSPLTYEWNMLGKWVAMSDVAVVAPTLGNETPPATMGTNGFTIGTDTFISNGFELDCGWNLKVLPDYNNLYGVYSIEQTRRQPVGKVNICVPKFATKDIEALFGTSQAFSFTVGATAGNIITVSGHLAFNGADPAEDDGIFVYEIPVTLVGSSGDDELLVVYT